MNNINDYIEKWIKADEISYPGHNQFSFLVFLILTLNVFNNIRGESGFKDMISRVAFNSYS